MVSHGDEGLMPSANLGPCPDCGHAVSRLAEACPSCGRPLRKPQPREGLYLRTMNQAVKATVWFVVLFFLVPIVAVIIGVWWSRSG